MNVQFLVSLIIAMGFVSSLEAVCCKRKGNFLCCGNGKCNIFCCNCKGGCNQQCQATHCSTKVWLKCAGAVAACAGVCSAAEIDLPACVACLGPLYELCKKCYSSGVNKPRAMSDSLYMMQAYHNDLYNFNMDNPYKWIILNCSRKWKTNIKHLIIFYHFDFFYCFALNMLFIYLNTM